MELCISLNRFKMFDSKIDLHRNQKAIQCLNNNNNSSNAFAKEVLAWHWFEFHIVGNVERRQMVYGIVRFFKSDTDFNINLSLLIKVK